MVFANTFNGLCVQNRNNDTATLRASPSGAFNRLASDGQNRPYLSVGDLHINGDKLC